VRVRGRQQRLRLYAGQLQVIEETIMNSTRWLVLASLVVGCSSSHNTPPDMSPTVMRPAGFNPPAPEAGETEFDSPIIPAIAPGTDTTLCSYLDTRITDQTDVVHFRVLQSTTGHHAILYAAKQTRDVGTHVCTDDDMVNSRFIAAGGSESIAMIAIPDGLAFRIPANTQLMMQTHWINATQNTVDGQAVALVTMKPTDPSRQVLDLFNIVNTNFTIPAGQTVTSSSTCAIKQDLQLMTITGHEHEFGSHVSIEQTDGAQTTMLWNHDWQPSYQSAPPFQIYGVVQPLVLKAGQQVQVTCTWNNPGAVDLAFPREMCVATGFYFPATQGEIDCVDGHWGG
jgi:hypothetical protein